MDYLDAHIHLSDNEYSNYLSHILFSLRCLKITACSVTVNLATSKKYNFVNTQKDVIIQFIGIHPEFAIKENIEDFREFLVLIYNT
jgi:TatD DNase family protein